MKYVFGTVAFLLFCLVAYVGFDRQEIVECRTWATEAQEYQSYYILKWQHDQCEAHGIKVEAPIK